MQQTPRRHDGTSQGGPIVIVAEAEQLSRTLDERGWRIVFAESCTAGLVPALLAAVPGISHHLCGSWVTYREECKQAWLGVPAELLAAHSAVSAEVTGWMATEALRRTESAHFAAAVTGHLGPSAPALQDGICFVAVAGRTGGSVHLLDHQCVMLSPTDRVERQYAAARNTLAFCAHVLQSQSG